MNKVISFLELNGFSQVEKNGYANKKCSVLFQKGGGYAVIDNEGNAMYSIDSNIYWLIGVLTYYGFINKNYVDLP